MLEKWKSTFANEKRFGAPLSGLSKGFYCLFHNFLIAKHCDLHKPIYQRENAGQRLSQSLASEGKF